MLYVVGLINRFTWNLGHNIKFSPRFHLLAYFGHSTHSLGLYLVNRPAGAWARPSSSLFRRPRKERLGERGRNLCSEKGQTAQIVRDDSRSISLMPESLMPQSLTPESLIPKALMPKSLMPKCMPCCMPLPCLLQVDASLGYGVLLCFHRPSRPICKKKCALIHEVGTPAGCVTEFLPLSSPWPQPAGLALPLFFAILHSGSTWRTHEICKCRSYTTVFVTTG